MEYPRDKDPFLKPRGPVDITTWSPCEKPLQWQVGTTHHADGRTTYHFRQCFDEALIEDQRVQQILDILNGN